MLPGLIMTMLMMVMMMTKMWMCGCVRRREHRLVPRIVRKGIKGGNSAVMSDEDEDD